MYKMCSLWSQENSKYLKKQAIIRSGYLLGNGIGNGNGMIRVFKYTFNIIQFERLLQVGETYGGTLWKCGCMQYQLANGQSVFCAEPSNTWNT